MGRMLRIAVLLLILLFVSLNTFLSKTRSTDWNNSLWVVIYPINGDQRADTQDYIESLITEHFVDIETFFQKEVERYRVPLDEPIKVMLSNVLTSNPPEPPENPSLLDNVLRSLTMRYWSWKNDNWDGVEPDIRIYMRFFSPKGQQALRHSLGLQKGLIGVVNGYADVEYQGQNNFIAAHELLHTLGATDKYDPKTSWPLWPDGYAEPTKTPLLPQTKAEIMGGRVQVSPSIALIPPSLEHAVVGAATAIEINWLSGSEH